LYLLTFVERTFFPNGNEEKIRMTIAAVADTHLGPYGGSYHGIDPWATLDRVLMLIDRIAPDMVIHAGDVVSRPAGADTYRQFIGYLEQYGPQIPWHIISGNHDDASAFSAVIEASSTVFPLSFYAEPAVIPVGPGQNLVLLPDDSPAQAIATLDSRATWDLVVTHRHILPVGTPWIDTTIHPQAELIIERAGRQKTQLLLCGHVHRWEHRKPDIADRPGFPILSLDSTTTRFAMETPEWALISPQPSIAILTWTEELNIERFKL
jgi:3',5'-cyclic-AMP phosphodiesterase